MEQIKVNIKNENEKYTITIGNSVSSLLAGFIKKRHKGRKVVVITDDNVKAICSHVLKALKPMNPYLISVPAGEKSKTRETKQKIEDMLLEKKYGRDTVIIALGGGVVGDLAGFIASTYNRGIPLIQVPTTLLAMVDSSIGGKTGVDTKYGKNLIGTVCQPDAVFADLNFLSSLPEKEFLNGLAEIIKIAVTSDKALFSFIEKNSGNILKKEKNSLLHIIRRSIRLKKDVVEKDAKEYGLRQILNFGHTIGHALEANSSYAGKHGRYVSLGIAAESRIAVLSGNLKREGGQRIIALLKAVGLPVKINENVNIDKIIGIMAVDKKSRSQKPRFVILKGIGKIKSDSINFSFNVNKNIIKKSVEALK